ncbi:LacI family DNA-binding transcriptional regulator [Kribbella sp. NPDC051770]|uniref:LacI family DNA-binding transcriptional regulator n=1 Tax=Kribbella sp. NPDC051770 TaxID=3155413 RepID=UPI003431B36F
MTRTPTLEDVATVAGVSRATVSRVINDVATVAPALRTKVQHAIKKTGYRPNSAARALAGSRAGAVVLVVSGSDGTAEEIFDDPFFGRVAGGMIAHLGALGIPPIVVAADSDRARADSVALIRHGRADGAVLVSTRADDPLPGVFVDAGIPAVLFARPALPAPISYVDLAHEAGAALAADHLVTRGCQRVVTIAGPTDVLAAQDRLTGFRQAMARHGHAHVAVAHGNFTQDSGESAMHHLLSTVPDLDAVFAANDLMAVGALRALRDTGRPDVAVIGFDNSKPAINADLTTIAQPLEDMAAEMSRLLLAQIADPTQGPQCRIFEPSLVIRATA